MMISEKELIDQIKNAVLIILDSIGLLKNIKVKENTHSGILKQISNLLIEVQTNTGDKYLLIFGIKTAGQPRFARMAVNQLKETVSQNANYYGVFASTYISKETKQICRDSHVGFIDISGNCFFNFDSIFISVEGKSNSFPGKNPLKTLFYSKSSRAARVLLCNPGESWFIKDLSREAEISIGQTFKVKSKLLEEEYIETLPVNGLKKFKLKKPEELLNRWAKNYSYKKNIIRNYYSLDDIKITEGKITDYCNSKKIAYAFTLTSGASLAAPFLRYNRVYVYISDNIETVAKDLNFKEVSSGANISILEPYDEGIFYKLQEIEGAKVVCNIQLYLDLKSYKERGEEAADFLYEQRIRKSW